MINQDYYCTFQLNKRHLWQCSRCHWTYPKPKDKPPIRFCPKQDPKKKQLKYSDHLYPQSVPSVQENQVNINPPSIVKRGKSYLSERTKWKKAGKPTRSLELIKYIFETFCKQCEHFSGKICNICGCYINDDDGWNKIAWQTTNCPLEKPKWDQNTQLPSSVNDKKKTQETPPEPKLKQKKKKGGGCGCSSK